ncbi:MULTISPECIES: hypothetical protein [Streptomyces]|nr:MULTISPECIES: hypothetical protein [Streptomyces]MYU54184.1 hypothetical protein [Streptomyces sp. SID7805]
MVTDKQDRVLFCTRKRWCTMAATFDGPRKSARPVSPAERLHELLAA